MRITVRSLKEDLYAAQDAAKLAADQWQTALDAQRIDRYSAAAKGKAGSELRRLRDAKIAADDKVRELTDVMRRFQDVNQIARP